MLEKQKINQSSVGPCEALRRWCFLEGTVYDLAVPHMHYSILKLLLSSLLPLSGNNAYNHMFRDGRNRMRQPIDLVVPFVRAF